MGRALTHSARYSTSTCCVHVAMALLAQNLPSKKCPFPVWFAFRAICARWACRWTGTCSAITGEKCTSHASRSSTMSMSTICRTKAKQKVHTKCSEQATSECPQATRWQTSWIPLDCQGMDGIKNLVLLMLPRAKKKNQLNLSQFCAIHWKSLIATSYCTISKP